MTNETLLKQVRELKSLKMMAKELEEEINRVEDMLKAEMESRQTSKLTVDVFTLNYTTVVSHRLDTAAIKKELPDIANRYMKESTSKRFAIT